MSSSATTTPITRTASHRAHQTPGESSRPHRSQSTRVGAPPNSPHRSSSQSHRTNPTQGGLQNVARRDFEQTNLPQTGSSRRSVSRDRANPDPNRQQYPVRSDSMRANTHHRQSSRTDRYTSIDAAAQHQTPTNGVAVDINHARPTSEVPRSVPHSSSSRPAQSSTGGRRRTTIDTSTGRWGLGKTIGAGSMGKVKLAKNLETGEQVCLMGSCSWVASS
jgi:hypothetical protein